MKIHWERTPMPGERFEGVYISKTGVARRDPAALVKSAEVQDQVKAVRELRMRQIPSRPDRVGD